MSTFVRVLDKIVNHDGLNLLIGVILLLCGINETIGDLEEEFSPAAHHGMVVFGLIHSVKSLSAILKSAQNIGENQRSRKSQIPSN